MTPQNRKKQDTKFKPGKSGNPGGRPKQWFELRDVLNKAGYVPGVKDQCAVELAALTLVSALKGADRVPAAKTILAYGVGLPAQGVEVSGPAGEALTIRVQYGPPPEKPWAKK